MKKPTAARTGRRRSLASSFPMGVEDEAENVIKKLVRGINKRLVARLYDLEIMHLVRRPALREVHRLGRWQGR